MHLCDEYHINNKDIFCSITWHVTRPHRGHRSPRVVSCHQGGWDHTRVPSFRSFVAPPRRAEETGRRMGEQMRVLGYFLIFNKKNRIEVRYKLVELLLCLLHLSSPLYTVRVYALTKAGYSGSSTHCLFLSFHFLHTALGHEGQPTMGAPSVRTQKRHGPFPGVWHADGRPSFPAQSQST